MAYIQVVKIISSIFLVLATFFIFQPLFSSQQSVTKMKCCEKMMSCHKKKQSPRKACEGMGCNPFMACAYGNFYVVEKSDISFKSLVVSNIKIVPSNDNRLADNLSDCWHPPRKEPAY